MNSERAKRYLEELRLDALISSSRENTAYLTSFLSVNYVQDRIKSGGEDGGFENFVQTYGIYTSSGESVLVLPTTLFMTMKIDSSVTNEVYTYGRPISLRDPSPKYDTQIERQYEEHLSKSSRNFPSPELALMAAVREFAPGGKIGVDYSDLQPSTRRALEAEKKLDVKRANVLFRIIRLTKSVEEIERLRHSAEVNERALSSVFKVAKEGVVELDLKRVYAENVVQEGGDFDTGHLIMASGTRSSSSLARPMSFRLSDGSLFKLDVTCRVNGYFADTGESGVVGSASEKQTKIYSTLREVVQKAEDIATPGLKCGELHREVLKIWSKNGLEAPPTGMGHGIGLEVHEYPSVSEASSKQSPISDDLIKQSLDMPFEQGMILNFEAPYLLSGWGGVHLERTVLIEKNGSKLLIDQDRHLRIL